MRHYLATSSDWMPRLIRRVVHGLRRFSLPVPRPIGKILLFIFRTLRAIYYVAFRLLVAEPIFKAYCRSYGKNVRTDVFIHWIQGGGDIVLGDDILFDGKSSITFAARFTERPTLTVGSGTGIGHGCGLTIAKRISIGRNCRIAAGVWIFDSTGHASDPAARLANAPPSDADVKPVVIADNVWIGGRAVVFPGVTIGEGSIVSACAVVTADVAPYSIVAGNPARRVGTLQPPDGQTSHVILDGRG